MFKYLLAVSALAASALAQGVIISQPPAGTTVAPGQNITVQITRPTTISSSVDVGVALAISSCGSSCAGIDDRQNLGDVLYHGAYDPQQYAYGGVPHQGSWVYENFTVTIPTYLKSGEAALSCAHFYLGGAGPYPTFDVVNVTMNVQA